MDRSGSRFNLVIDYQQHNRLSVPAARMDHSAPIAVVVPMRDARKWLPSLLAALVREWDTSFELVVVDDGSRDGSAELLQRLCRHWPKHRWQLIDGGGRGVSASRNQGVKAAKSDYIAFLDADDRPLPGRLTLPLQVLQAHPELSHVHGGWWRCDSKGHKQHAVRPWQEGAGFSWQTFMEHKAVLPSAWTLRREAFLAVGGFDEQLRHSEDVDLGIRLAAADHQGRWIEQELVRYRVHGESASAKLKPQLLGLLEVMDRHLQQAPESAQAWARDLRYGTTTWAVWQAWQANDHALSLQLLRQALIDCPYPLVRRPVHLIEAFQRSHDRIGECFDRSLLLKSNFWQQAEALLLAR